MANFQIGISGWNYPGWRGDFYPHGLPHRRELEYATRIFNSLEINGTFYSLKTPRAFQNWAEQAPDDFLFAVKGGRYITHTLRLREVKTALANFFASGLLRLGTKLGPLLWQLPPQMKFQPEHVAAFCDLLPKDTMQAAELARQHDQQVSGRAWFDVKQRHRLRHAFEVRDESFLCDEFVRLLRRSGHALVFADTAKKYPLAEDLTAGFVYIRLHGSQELYANRYDDSELRQWKGRIERWARGEQMKTGRRISDAKPPARKARDVYVYFDNDAKGHAPFDAIRLAELLGVARDWRQLRGRDGHPFAPPPRLDS